jgi:hypothetical protein
MEEEELARRTGLAFGSWHVNWYLVLAGVSWEFQPSVDLTAGERIARVV